jgi:hypothetical protein
LVTHVTFGASSHEINDESLLMRDGGEPRGLVASVEEDVEQVHPSAAVTDGEALAIGGRVDSDERAIVIEAASPCPSCCLYT